MIPDAVTLLGVKGGPAIRPGSSMPTCSLVELGGRRILVDASLGAAAGVVRAGVLLGSLDAVIVTHLHSDHYLELGPLLHTAWTAGLRTAIPVWGPSGLATYWEGFLSSMAFDIDLRIRDEGRPDLRDLVEFHVLDDRGEVDLGGITLAAMRNVHPPIKDSFALRLSAPGRVVVLSGDTAPMPQMVDFARNADLLVHEAMLISGVDALCARVGNGDDRLKQHLLRSHSPAAEVAKIAAAAGVRALALNHLIPNDDPDFSEADWRRETKPHFKGPLHIGQDGMRIVLPSKDDTG